MIVMKNLIATTLLFLLFNQSHAQCNVQTNIREDGTTVKYLSPDRVGLNDKIAIGLAMQTNGEQFFVTTLTIFEKDAKRLTGTMTLKFANNKSSTFEHYKSEFTTFKGMPATISIFICDENDLQNISSSNVTIVMVQLDNGEYQAVKAELNSDILKKYYNCLK